MGKFRSGLVFGAIIGGFIGLMKAPKSGKEFRLDIKNFIDTTTHDIDDLRYKTDNLKQSISRLTDEGLVSLKEASQDIQVSLQHFQEENQPRVNRIQDRVDTLQESIKSQMN